MMPSLDSYAVEPDQLALNKLERGPIEPWRRVGAAGQPGYLHPCQPQAGEHIAFRKLPSGLVEMRGSFDCATAPLSADIFYLPSGYYPPRAFEFGGYFSLTDEFGTKASALVIKVSVVGTVSFQRFETTGTAVDVVALDHVRYQLRIAR